MLREWAERFTCDTNVRDQIVEVTICALIEDPDQIRSTDVRSSLLDVLERVAKSTIDWRRGPLDINIYPERNGYVLELSNGTKSDKMRFTSEKFALGYAKSLNSRTLTLEGRVIPFRVASESERHERC